MTSKRALPARPGGEGATLTQLSTQYGGISVGPEWGIWGNFNFNHDEESRAMAGRGHGGVGVMVSR